MKENNVTLLLSKGLLSLLLLAIGGATQAADVAISGVVEVEGAYVEDYAKQKTTGIGLATVEIALQSKVNKTTQIDVLMLHEDGDTEPQEVDSATVTFTDLPLAATAVMGRQYLPFGVFNSNHISDPLTLELGETREAAVYVSSGFSNTSLGVAFFNGKIHNLTESNADPNYNIDYQYSRESGSFSVGVAAYYLSNLAHAEGLFAALPTQATVSKKAPAMGLALSLGFGPAQIIAECMQAEKAFSAADFTHAGKGAKPAACQYELGYTMGKATLALGYQTTEQLLFLELPKARSLLSYSLATSDNTTIALELAQDEDYATTDGGTGKTQNIVTGQIAVSF